jgi:hypothetical protein
MSSARVEPALRALIASGGKPDIRSLLEDMLAGGERPEALAELMRGEIRTLCGDLISGRTFLTESLLPAHYVLEGQRWLRETGALKEEAPALLMGCMGSAYASPYHSALRIFAEALGHPVTELGCGLGHDGPEALWAAHPGALGLILYDGGLCASRRGPDPSYSVCCMGRSRVFTALPGGPALPPDELLRRPLPPDLGLMIRLAVLLG